MRRIATCIVIAAAILLPALASALSDEEYTSKFFGTTAVLKTAKQIVDPNTAWWGEKMPQQLNDSSYVLGVVNAHRTAANQPLLPVGDESVVMFGSETPVAGGFEYTVDFTGLVPSEVQLVLDTLGGLEKVVPTAALSFRPLNRRSFYVSATSPDGDIVLPLDGEELHVSMGMSMSDLRDKLQSLLGKRYGPGLKLDIYFSRYSYSDGSSGADFSVYVEIPTDLVPPQPAAVG